MVILTTVRPETDIDTTFSVKDLKESKETLTATFSGKRQSRFYSQFHLLIHVLNVRSSFRLLSTTSFTFSLSES